MAFLTEPLQKKAEGGAGAIRRLRINAEPAAKVVGGLEADAPDVGGEAIRVAATFTSTAWIAIGFIDADGREPYRRRATAKRP